jgi:hypothetical protein
MTARVITDPSALGWVLDPDTGRWEWSGSGDGGGVEEAPEDGIQYARQDAAWSPIESGGGGAWDVIERVDLAGADQYDFDEFPDTHTDFRVIYELKGDPSWNNREPTLQIKEGGSSDVIAGSNLYANTQFLPNSATGTSASRNWFTLNWGLSTNFPHMLGDIYLRTAGTEGWGKNTSRKQYAEVSGVTNNKLNSGCCHIDCTDGQIWTGFRFNTGGHIAGGYICLMGLKRD